MNESIVHGLEIVARLLEIVGASALILGFVIATARGLHGAGRDGALQASVQYRRALGRTVLIGLEVLVAATIIKTITVKPTLEGVGLLVLMIVIRTVLGWTMVLEMNGRWPWQRPRPSDNKDI